uniref:VCBS repeat-containing protein n=1 Tax=Roseihalotalea indica TaxID=2867963 RepID=A0AA49GLX2_9BACT|nr:VCBS repeat-containing protein [Tunicatimonas sp. TK19036]
MNTNNLTMSVRGVNVLFLSLIGGSMFAQSPPPENISKPVQFERKTIAMESYESVGAFDIDGDDTLDLISGAYWYEGPDYEVRHFVIDVERWNEYYNDFSTIPVDVNADGNMDYVTGAWGNQIICWRENPGNGDPWVEHLIDSTGPVECTRGWDIDGDGNLEIVPNNPGNALKFYRMDRDAQGKSLGTFTKVDVADNQGHGLGFGDLNGDGRGDLISADGWYEAPEDPLTGTWTEHKELSLGPASVPILVEDVNGDGKNDVIVGQGHGYGLSWYEQSTDEGGKRSWIAHPIDPYNSQFHTMEWIDVTGDGQPELVTGKRYRAHNGHDPGSGDPLGLYYFQWNGESFTKHTIAYGPLGVGKGAGLYMAIVDLRGTGRNDIVVAGKDGLCVFYNEGYGH